jgi:hypothetical protein
MPGNPMPSFFRPFFCAVLLVSAVLPAARTVAMPADSDSSIVIHQTGRVLVFPTDLLMEGVPSGEVQVVLSVDAKGVLSDCLVVGYTNSGFADEVVQALKTWSYEPARVHGRALASRVDLKVTFKSDVSVMVVNLSQHYWELLSGDWRRYAYRAYKLGELDRIPTPVQVVQPVLPKGDTPRGAPHRVTVEFFIDEKGRVRVPTVDRDEVDDVYAAAMVTAVEQWRFEPPMRHGRPVLVIAQQDFDFRPKQ